VRLLANARRTASVDQSFFFTGMEQARKHSMIVKVTIDEQTAMKLLSLKPNTTPTATFCSLLIEYGLEKWERLQQSQVDWQ